MEWPINCYFHFLYRESREALAGVVHACSPKEVKSKMHRCIRAQSRAERHCQASRENLAQYDFVVRHNTIILWSKTMYNYVRNINNCAELQNVF